MRTKYLSFVIIACALFCSFHVTGQDWRILGDDPIDVDQSGFVDIIEVACRFENDTIGFRIVVDTSGILFTPDFGIAIGIDTNLVLQDGIEDFESSNTDFSPDIVVSYLTNSAFPSFLPDEMKYISATKDTLILRLESADLDPDLSFNFVIGSTNWYFDTSHDVPDVVPNEGVFTFDVHTGIESHELVELEFFPNPVSDNLYVQDIRQNSQYQISDSFGKRIAEGFYIDFIDASKLSEGVYFVNFENGIGGFKFVKL